MSSHYFKLHRSYNFIYFIKFWRKCLGLNPKEPYLSLEKEKENFCAVFTKSIKRAREIRKFQDADLKLTNGRLRKLANKLLRNLQKSVQSCCFTNVNLLLFLPFSLPSPSLLLKLPIVVIRKCYYHGNVTSHFSSLLLGDKSVCFFFFFPVPCC